MTISCVTRVTVADLRASMGPFCCGAAAHGSGTLMEPRMARDIQTARGQRGRVDFARKLVTGGRVVGFPLAAAAGAGISLFLKIAVAGWSTLLVIPTRYRHSRYERGASLRSN
jgi:hypothetical protein